MSEVAARARSGGVARWAVRLRVAWGEAVLAGVGLLITVFLLLIFIELLVLAIGALREGLLFEAGELTFVNFRTIVGGPDFVPVARNTALLAIGSTTIMLVWSVPFAWLYTRTDLPGKRWFLLLLTIRIAIPSFLTALAYAFLLNPSSGMLNKLLMEGFGLRTAPFNVYSLPWIIFLQGTALTTPAFFMMAPAFGAIEGSLEEAAYASGLSRGRTFFGILLPLLRPAIVVTGMYYLIVSMEVFDYAAVLGLPARIYVFSTWIFLLVNPSVGMPHYGEASVIGFLMVVLGAILVAIYLRATRRAERFAVVTGKRSTQHVTKLGRKGTLFAWSAIGLFALIEFVAPIVILLWASLVPYLQPPSVAALSVVTVQGYEQALAELPLLLKNTLLLAFTVPTLSVAAALCISWVVIRTKLAGRHLIDGMVMASIGIPSVVVALAFLYFGLSIFRYFPLYTTIWIMVVAMSARYLTWGTRTINSAMYQLHRELEEACVASGVGPGRTFLSVITPLVRPALFFSWFWIALLSMRELTIPILLSRRDTQVFATAIWGFNAAGSPAIAAALGVMLLLLISVMVMVFHRFAGARGG